MSDIGYSISVSPNGHLYWFTSVGPNGSITKVVSMQPMAIIGRYNLAMADVINDELDFNNITNNKDLDRVFGTVAKIVRHFTGRYRKAEIFFAGANAVRTRLYRIKVSNNLELITREFNVYGVKGHNDNFEKFKKGEPYSGILVSRK